MQVTGPTLFDAGDLTAVLLINLSDNAREIVFDRSLRSPPVSKLALRRAIIPRVTFHNETRLGDPGPVELDRDGDAADGKLCVSCDLPFQGDGRLFRLGVPLWPRPRPVRGRVEGQILRLTAEGSWQDVPWFPALLEAEVAIIEQIVAAHAEVVTSYNRDVGRHVRSLVERVSPRINREALKYANALSDLLPADNPGFPLLLVEAERERNKLWRTWTQ